MQAIFRYGERTTVPYTPSQAVVAGQVIVLTDMVGIAPLAIPANKLGALDVSGVFEFVKKTETEMVQGDSAYWDATGDPVDGVAESGAADTNGENAELGLVAEAATEDAATVLVNLNQVAVASA